MASETPEQPPAGEGAQGHWHSEAVEWYLAGGLILAASAILLAAVVSSGLWEADTGFKWVPWAVGFVALAVIGLGTAFCRQGYLRRENRALLAKGVRGAKLVNGLLLELIESWELEPLDSRVWPNFGYWKPICRYRIAGAGPEKRSEKEKGEEEANGGEEAGSLTCEVKEIWLTPVFYGTLVSYSTEGKQGDKLQKMERRFKSLIERLAGVSGG